MSAIKLRLAQKGFTIVELLIVIVVIGILASITVVAYNGVSERARNSSRLTAAKQSIQIMELALTEKTPLEIRATLNHPDSWWRACIGTGYPDLNGNGVGDCARFGSNPPYVTESAAFNALLQSVGSLPSMANYPPATAADGDVTRGPYFGSAWVDSKDMLVVEYTLEGLGKDCALYPLVYKNGGSSSMTPAGGASTKYSAQGDGMTECVVAVVTSM